MLVWRVEHKETGEGPYRCDWNLTTKTSATKLLKSRKKLKAYAASKFAQHLSDTHSNCNTHPVVTEDVDMSRSDFVNKGYYCGFSSFQQYRAWFRGLFTGLNAHDFELRIYSVPPQFVKHGRKQVGFQRNKATLIATKPIVRSPVWMNDSLNSSMSS